MADTNQQLERIEVLLSQSLLGEQFINTQLHIFSARSTTSGRVVKPRVLSANNALLANGSKYFADLLSSERSLFDPMMVDIPDGDEVPSEMDEYEYDSDSDLEDDDPPLLSTVDAKTPEAESHPVPASSAIHHPHSTNLTAVSTGTDDEAIEDDGSDAVASDIFLLDQVMTGSDASHNSQAGTPETKGSTSQRAVQAARAPHPEVRHILVRDGAFRTWYALLNYLYTGRITFMPLKSAVSSTSHASELSCSAKSMYRLANKVGLDKLGDEALDHISRGLTEHNILRELSCSLLSSYPQLLEVELGVLNDCINTPPVATGFSSFARRIANKELPHGSEIILFITSKLLEARRHGDQRSAETRASSQPLQPQAVTAAEMVQRFADRLAIMFQREQNQRWSEIWQICRAPPSQ